MSKILSLLILIGLSAVAEACLEPPLPTSPSGPTWSEVFESRNSVSGDLRWSANVTAWRHVCDDSEPLLLITYEPIFEAPFVCSPDIIQSGVQYNSARLLQDPNSYLSSFCGNLLVKSSFALVPRSSGLQWDPNQGFSAVYDSKIFLEVGKYQASDYGVQNQLLLTGSLSGSWYDPARVGEGFIIEFGENNSGPVAVLYWFTHRENEPYWLIGSKSYERGQKGITFDLVEVSGTGFGDDFNSKEIDQTDFGAISIEFDSCTSGIATWESLDGQTGSFDLRRITENLHEIGCDE